MRLDKYLADMQVGTRSQVKEYIRKGRVSVDGIVVKQPDYKLDETRQTVVFDGTTIGYVSMEYYMLNKPAGVLSATTDKKTETVVDLIESARKDLFPVGRLDKDTEGLLLITNDGQLAHDLLSPKNGVDKVYYAKVMGRIGDEHIALFKQGLLIDKDFTAMPAKLEVIHAGDDLSEVFVTVMEGKFHQVKRMFLAVGSEVLYLKRVSMGPLMLDESLGSGEYRHLTKKEIDELKAFR